MVGGGGSDPKTNLLVKITKPNCKQSKAHYFSWTMHVNVNDNVIKSKIMFIAFPRQGILMLMLMLTLMKSRVKLITYPCQCMLKAALQCPMCPWINMFRNSSMRTSMNYQCHHHQIFINTSWQGIIISFSVFTSRHQRNSIQSSLGIKR